MAEDSFESPKLLLDGAHENIHDLETRCQAFIDSCTYTPFIEPDPQGRYNCVKVRVSGELPKRLRVVASNALNNLRHALDQAVNAAAVELGGKRRNNYFPFARDISEFNKIIPSRCPTVPASLIPLIKAFQPYGGGDDLLYAMSQMSGPNKHQLVVRLDIDVPDIALGHGWVSMNFLGPGRLGALAWDAAKQELELAHIEPGGRFELYDELKLPIMITLGDGKIARSEPAPAFLNALASKVDGIISAIEAETAHLKALP